MSAIASSHHRPRMGGWSVPRGGASPDPQSCFSDGGRSGRGVRFREVSSYPLTPVGQGKSKPRANRLSSSRWGKKSLDHEPTSHCPTTRRLAVDLAQSQGRVDGSFISGVPLLRVPFSTGRQWTNLLTGLPIAFDRASDHQNLRIRGLYLYAVEGLLLLPPEVNWFHRRP